VFQGGFNTGFNLTEATNLGYLNWFDNLNLIKNNCPDSKQKCDMHMKLDFSLQDNYIEKVGNVLKILF
jgi:hypothetical protein